MSGTKARPSASCPTLPDVWRSLFFITVHAVAVAVIAVLIRKTQERLLVIAFSLIMAGAQSAT